MICACMFLKRHGSKKYFILPATLLEERFTLSVTVESITCLGSVLSSYLWHYCVLLMSVIL